MHKGPTQRISTSHKILWEWFRDCHNALREIGESAVVELNGSGELYGLSERIESALEVIGSEMIDSLTTGSEEGGDASVPGTNSAPLPF